MILGNQDSGRTVEAKARSIVTVCLKENPTTGYRWKVETSGGLELISDSFEKGGDAIGAAGIRVFQFRTPDEGSHKLSMRNWRDWEGESSIIDQFCAIIEVK
jgi:predicted secreted protein